MKKLKNIKPFVLALVLLVGIVGVGSTVALLTSTSNPVVNSFKAITKVETKLEEDVDDRDVSTETDLLKQPYVVNTYGVALIRARITVSPSDLAVTLKSGTWDGYDFTETGIVYQDGEFKTVSGSNWVYLDGWYYYTVVTAANTDYAQTSTLFDAVYLGDTVTADDEIDIAVYQESIYAAGYSAGTMLDATTIKDLFEN